VIFFSLKRLSFGHIFGDSFFIVENPGSSRKDNDDEEIGELMPLRSGIGDGGGGRLGDGDDGGCGGRHGGLFINGAEEELVVATSLNC